MRAKKKSPPNMRKMAFSLKHNISVTYTNSTLLWKIISRRLKIPTRWDFFFVTKKARTFCQKSAPNSQYFTHFLLPTAFFCSLRLQNSAQKRPFVQLFPLEFIFTQPSAVSENFKISHLFTTTAF